MAPKKPMKRCRESVEFPEEEEDRKDFRIFVKPPKNFDTKTPGLWPRWLRTFGNYRIASGLDGCRQARQVAVLLHILGEDGQDLLDTISLTEDDRQDYNKVVAALNKVFASERNVTYERAKFNLLRQEQDDSFDVFLAALVEQIDFCNYTELRGQKLRDELIKDRIVVGIKDKKLSLKLQKNEELTLEEAIQMCKLRESIIQRTNNEPEQGTAGSGAESTPTSVDRVGSRRKRPRRMIRSLRKSSRVIKVPDRLDL